MNRTPPATGDRLPRQTRAERIERVAFWLVAACAALLHWIPAFPPMMDVPQHAAQMRLLHDWTSDGFEYRDILYLNFFTPYLPAYLLGAALTFVMPVVAAINTVWTLAVFGLVAATSRLRRQLGGAPELDWLVLPGLFGLPFLLGFVTFQLALPFALLLVGHWMVFLDQPTRRRGTWLALGAVGLFFAHSLAFAWAMLVCGTMLLLDVRLTRAVIVEKAQLAIPLLAPLPVIALWFRVAQSAPQTSEPIVWVDLFTRGHDFMSSWLALGGIDGVIVGALLIASPVFAGHRLAGPIRSRVPLYVTLLILFAVPYRIFGNAFTYDRYFALLGPSLALALSVRAPALRSWARRAALPAIATVWVAAAAMRMAAFADEQRDFRRVLAAIPPGAHLLSIVPYGNSSAIQFAATYLHFGQWHQATTGGLTEFSFATLFPMIVRFRPDYRDALPWHVEPQLGTPEATRAIRRFPFTLVRDSSTSAPPLTDSTLTLMVHDGMWWLYRNSSHRPSP